MKKFLLSALAATVALSPIAATAAEAAPRYDRGQRTTVVKHKANGRTVVIDRRVNDNRGYDRGNRGYGRNNAGYHRWNKGQRFDRRYARNYRVVDYRQYRGRGLYAPPRGYQWAQSGNDAVLIALTSGLIGAVLGGALR